MSALTICCVGAVLAAFAPASLQSGTFIRIKEYPGSIGPLGITAGPDGAMWFTEAFPPTIGRISTSGAITVYPVPTANSQPINIVAGPDGALWFTEYSGNKIGRVTVAGVITEYPLPKLNSYPYGIAMGPDGHLWFAEINQIGRITTGGDITEYPVPTADGQPMDITSEPDGALWFTEYSAGKIGRITTAGAVAEYPVRPFGLPWWITAGPDGALWYTVPGAPGAIGRMTTSGVVTERTGFAGPEMMVTGPDGALWFAESGGNQVGRITTTGEITRYVLPTADSSPWGIAVGPAGDLWLTEWLGSRIARMPTCALGLGTSFANHTLTMSFNMGINRGAIWSVSAGENFGFARHIPPVTHTRPLSLNYRPDPNQEKLAVVSSLSDEARHVLCSEWTTVYTSAP